MVAGRVTAAKLASAGDRGRTAHAAIRRPLTRIFGYDALSRSRQAAANGCQTVRDKHARTGYD